MMVTFDTQSIACMYIIINPILCINTFISFQTVDVYEGNVLLKIYRGNVYECVFGCHQHTPSCLATRYNESSEECQLLGKEATVPTTTFVSNADHILHKKVCLIMLISIDMCFLR